MPREPALLSVGEKQNNYESLANYLEADATLSTSATQTTDTVTFALDKVSSKMITELATLTAETITEYPEFKDDYVLAIIDDGNGNREARVYSREEIAESQGATGEEKARILEALEKEPLVVFSSAEGLPESSSSEAAAKLSEKVAKFLTNNDELLDLLDSYGYNPFEKLKL
jgi:hypothetical protein